MKQRDPFRSLQVAATVRWRGTLLWARGREDLEGGQVRLGEHPGSAYPRVFSHSNARAPVQFKTRLGATVGPQRAEHFSDFVQHLDQKRRPEGGRRTRKEQDHQANKARETTERPVFKRKMSQRRGNVRDTNHLLS